MTTTMTTTMTMTMSEEFVRRLRSGRWDAWRDAQALLAVLRAMARREPGTLAGREADRVARELETACYLEREACAGRGCPGAHQHYLDALDRAAEVARGRQS